MFYKTTRVQRSTAKIRKCIRIGCQEEFESVDAADRVCSKCRYKKRSMQGLQSSQWLLAEAALRNNRTKGQQNG